MGSLNTTQERECAAYWANEHFVRQALAAVYNLDDITAAIVAIDNAYDTTLNAAVSAGHGAQTIVQAMNAIIPAPLSGATAQQKTLLVAYVAMKRAGII
jgi:hypothetical protein